MVDFSINTMSQFKPNIGEHSYGTIKTIGMGELKMGKFCSIVGEVKVLFEGHRTDWITTYPFPDYWISMNWPNAQKIPKNHVVRKGPVIIGNDVWIGYGTTILSNVRIGDGAIIAAESLITSNVKSYGIYGGNPARFLGYRFNEDIIKILKKLKWWDWPSEKINKYIELLCNKPNLEKLKELLAE